MTKLLKKDLIELVAQKTGETKGRTREILDAASDVLHQSLADGVDTFVLGLGKIEVRSRGPRKARNLHTCEDVIVAPRNVAYFLPSESAKAAVNAKA